jgi:ribosome-binding protein aMBF1 (putative translation factor)
MNAHIEPQIISQNGKPAFAVIPWEEYQKLLVNRQEPDIWFPNDVVKASTRGASLIAAWREHFAMTQAELAAKSGMKQASIARLEKGHAGARRSTLAKVATAMGIMVEQLIE